ncbi:hypothetical protein FNF29_03759 [Cafeteria roenbergensis]|uniref:E3 ubiquitin-protein ligase CHFR n=1 Tax=Cafeteria roenbergensis TaxID=33653 RepID=A0A5A8CHL2_CAFRO|nr:hypothetical protein FNF29_03759 [Cafeteria roenbergensis]|eukprot:KAA0152532.1 hypothetical protein FNF29_03759 [Cafeteria roenbergensis]
MEAHLRYCGQHDVCPTVPNVVALATAETCFGRSSGCTVVLDSPAEIVVSRKHASITRYTRRIRAADGSTHVGCWVLRDHGSRNGTFVNYVRVQERQLRFGDVIHFGGGTRAPFEGLPVAGISSQFIYVFLEGVPEGDEEAWSALPRLEHAPPTPMNDSQRRNFLERQGLRLADGDHAREAAAMVRIVDDTVHGSRGSSPAASVPGEAGETVLPGPSPDGAPVPAAAHHAIQQQQQQQQPFGEGFALAHHQFGHGGMASFQPHVSAPMLQFRGGYHPMHPFAAGSYAGSGFRSIHPGLVGSHPMDNAAALQSKAGSTSQLSDSPGVGASDFHRASRERRQRRALKRQRDSEAAAESVFAPEPQPHFSGLLVNAASLGCGHSFCFSCAAEVLLRHSASPSCPTCSAPAAAPGTRVLALADHSEVQALAREAGTAPPHTAAVEHLLRRVAALDVLVAASVAALGADARQAFSRRVGDHEAYAAKRGLCLSAHGGLVGAAEATIGASAAAAAAAAAASPAREHSAGGSSGDLGRSSLRCCVLGAGHPDDEVMAEEAASLRPLDRIASVADCGAGASHSHQANPDVESDDDESDDDEVDVALDPVSATFAFEDPAPTHALASYDPPMSNATSRASSDPGLVAAAV